MFKSFLRTVVANISNNKTYSFLNIFGLSIGIACAALIFLWIEDEVSFDNMYPKKEQLYRILENQTYDGKTRTFWSSPANLGPAMQAEVPGVANTCRIGGKGRTALFRLGDKALFEKGSFTDASVFNLFSLQFVQGNARDAFKELYSVVITERMANHFFGNEKNVVGKVLQFDNKQNYIVSGVIKNFPDNSTLSLDWMAPFDIFLRQHEKLQNWSSNTVETYVELAPAANVAAINHQLYDFIEKKKEGATARCFLFAMKDWRLRDKFEDGKQAGGRIQYIRMFSVVAWIILLIACINFMNLATARSEKRAREVGVRKVLGAGKRGLVIQFIGEAVAMSVLAMLAGVALITLVLPLFNTLVEKPWLTIGLENPLHSLFLLGIALLCGLVAGSYPALYLSSFNPVMVLKGLKIKSGGATFIRKGLVVLQFTASIVLIISTIIIYQQISHVKNRELGYEKSNLIAVNVRGEMVKKYGVIKQQLINTGIVENVAFNSYNIFNIGNNTSGFEWKGKNPATDVLISYRMVSPEFVSTLGMELIAGRDFYGETATDSSNILITQSMAKMMGPGSAIGKKVTGQDGNSYEVVGVVKDFVYGDMYGKSDPVIFFCNPAPARLMYVRTKDQVKPEEAVSALETVMKRENPAYPFDYSFVNEQFNDLFKAEILVSKLSRVFAALAIVISCLGLFGLAAYTASRRTREIGIRKVLGASVSGVIRLLSTDFLQLVLLSNILALPLAWWCMHNWLQNYAYRTSIHGWVFVLAGITSVSIALFTISFQAVKTALMNPVKNLRNE